MQLTVTHTEEETIRLGFDFARQLKPGDVVALYGELGSGKTRFVQGVCKGLGVSEHVTSPTFTIINEYSGSRLSVYHFDFYRVKSLEEVRDIGFEEYLYGEGVCLIEWAERAQSLLPPERYEVRLEPGSQGLRRTIRIQLPAGVGA